MRSPVLTRQGKTLSEMIMARETMSQKVISDHHPQPPPPTGHRSIQNSVVPAVSKPNLASPHITVRGCQEDFFRSETAANFYSVRAWPWRRADGGADCAAAEMDWFLVVMQAGNWQQSDGWWNSWPVTVKIYSPDQTQSMKRLASRESLGLQNDIRIIKNIIEETVNSIEVNRKWLSSIYGAIII